MATFIIGARNPQSLAQGRTVDTIRSKGVKTAPQSVAQSLDHATITGACKWAIHEAHLAPMRAAQ